MKSNVEGCVRVLQYGAIEYTAPDVVRTYIEECDSVGKETLFKDSCGNALNVGDVVELYRGDKFLGTKFVIEDSINPRYAPEAYIDGIKCYCIGDLGVISGCWNIKLAKKYYDVKDGETHAEVTMRVV